MAKVNWGAGRPHRAWLFDLEDAEA